MMLGALLCGIVTTGCVEKADPEEPSKYFYHDGHSYMIVKQKRNWVEAAADAVANGGYLAEIGSQAEQSAIWQAILKEGIPSSYVAVLDGGGIGYIWIGAGDKWSDDDEGDWIWNGANKSGAFTLFWYGGKTGVAINGSYVNWGGTSKGSRNEPDNFTDSNLSPNGQNAAAIGLASWPAGSSSPLGIAGEWNDIAESNMLYYVIEFDTSR